MIVKVQLSEYTTHEVQQVLIYNEDRQVWFEGPATESHLILMFGRKKAYFNATTKNGQIVIDDEVPAQEW